MNKYKTVLRWLSLIPIAFTMFVLSDWVVRFLFWFGRLPIIIFNKIFGFGLGPIGKIMDNTTNYLVGLDGIETLVVTATGLATGSTAVYILAIVAPTNNKKTAKILTTIYLVLLALGLVAFVINGITGENVVWTIFLTIGILLGWHTIKSETEQETAKYEIFVKKHITTIFISTLLFTILLMGFFLGV